MSSPTGAHGEADATKQENAFFCSLLLHAQMVWNKEATDD